MTGRSRIARCIRRLARNRNGVAALEFALAMPVLLLGISAVVDLSSAMLVTTLVEGGIREASRYGITGEVSAGSTREQVIIDTIAENSHGLVDMSTAQVSTRVYPSFEDISQPEPFDDTNGNGVHDEGEPFNDVNGNSQWDADMGIEGVGGPGEIVLYTVTFDWRPLTPIAAPLIGHNGVLTLKASVAVRNEPYPLPAGG